MALITLHNIWETSEYGHPEKEGQTGTSLGLRSIHQVNGPLCHARFPACVTGLGQDTHILRGLFLPC